MATASYELIGGPFDGQEIEAEVGELFVGVALPLRYAEYQLVKGKYRFKQIVLVDEDELLGEDESEGDEPQP